MFHEGRDLEELFGKLGAPGGFPTAFIGFAGQGRSLKGKPSSGSSSSSSGSSSSRSGITKANFDKGVGAGGIFGTLLKLIGSKRLKSNR